MSRENQGGLCFRFLLTRCLADTYSRTLRLNPVCPAHILQLFYTVQLIGLAYIAWREEAEKPKLETDDMPGMLLPLTRWICALDIPGSHVELLARGIRVRRQG